MLRFGHGEHDFHEAPASPERYPIAWLGRRSTSTLSFVRQLGRRSTATLSFARQLGLILGAVLLYFGVRGFTQGDVDVAIANGLDVLSFERSLGIDIEHWAQALILDHHWLITLMNWIYIWGHWPVIVAVLVWLYRTRRPEYLQLRNAMFISGAIGLVIFVAYPVAPPRLIDVGLIDTVTDLSSSYRLLQPPSLVNKYAAVPSLHVGWNLLIGIAAYRASQRRSIRIASVISPILMTAAVVFTANHYIIDTILGAAVAMIGLAIAVSLTSPPTTGARRAFRTARSDLAEGWASVGPAPALAPVRVRTDGQNASLRK